MTGDVVLDERGRDFGFVMVGDVRAVYRVTDDHVKLDTGNWGPLSGRQWAAVIRFAGEQWPGKRPLVGS